jgi:hypothetical protein
MASMMMDRPTMMDMGMSAVGGAPTMMPNRSNWLMVPHCAFKMERMTGGMKMSCMCDDKMACSTMQNLCKMLAGGMCTCCMYMNGMMVCMCNLTFGMCKCEMTENGFTCTCTSGDKACAEMIQACCDCMATMLKDGCTCCFMMNNTPVCCGGV